MEVTRVEQRAFIEIAVLRDRNAMECRSELLEALGNNALPYRTVARWIGKFQQGRVSNSDEQLSGRPVSVSTVLARAVIEQLMDYIKSLKAQEKNLDFLDSNQNYSGNNVVLLQCVMHHDVLRKSTLNMKPVLDEVVELNTI
ncbi:uncharacterized protein TNCV_441 [Trichonephila clavipes]|nr:uncharacterized protein TNCV_441 [Trichonephila clavipes]